jgi:hypothetical protein
MPRSCSSNDMDAASTPYDPRASRPGGRSTTRRQPRQPPGPHGYHRAPTRAPLGHLTRTRPHRNDPTSTCSPLRRPHGLNLSGVAARVQTGSRRCGAAVCELFRSFMSAFRNRNSTEGRSRSHRTASNQLSNDCPRRWQAPVKSDHRPWLAGRIQKGVTAGRW